MELATEDTMELRNIHKFHTGFVGHHHHTPYRFLILRGNGIKNHINLIQTHEIRHLAKRSRELALNVAKHRLVIVKDTHHPVAITGIAGQLLRHHPSGRPGSDDYDTLEIQSHPPESLQHTPRNEPPYRQQEKQHKSEDEHNQCPYVIDVKHIKQRQKHSDKKKRALKSIYHHPIGINDTVVVYPGKESHGRDKSNVRDKPDPFRHKRRVLAH